MFVVQRMYRGVILPTEVDRRVVTGLVPAMRTLLGFTGYMTVDFDRGRFGTFTQYADRAAAEVVCNATPGAIRSMLADLIPAPPESRIGEVLHMGRFGAAGGDLTVRTYGGCPDVAALGRRMAAHVLPGLSAAPVLGGFTLLRMDDGAIQWQSQFDTLSHADAAHAVTDPLMEGHLADLLPHPAETMTGRVLSDIRE